MDLLISKNPSAAAGTALLFAKAGGCRRVLSIAGA